MTAMLTTSEVATLADVSRHTVEREIRRGNLSAEKISRLWVIDAAEAQRWAEAFQPYRTLRARHSGTRSDLPSDQSGS
jgi:excisionase family DNA binding protein